VERFFELFVLTIGMNLQQYQLTGRTCKGRKVFPRLGIIMSYLSCCPAEIKSAPLFSSSVIVVAGGNLSLSSISAASN
jgi:hypothetical protein